MPELTDPTVAATDPERWSTLRIRAASCLAGPAASKGPSARALDALTVLHSLASSPATAADALTLLHELQVHQVELDLQAQELHESRTELESALRRQTELYDHQPVGCFTIDARMRVHELNQTGAAMLGLARDDAFGTALDSFLCADSARRFRSTISSLAVDTGLQRASCRLTLCLEQGSGPSVLASVGKDPGGLQYLVSWAISEEEQDERPLAH